MVLYDHVQNAFELWRVATGHDAMQTSRGAQSNSSVRQAAS